MREGWFRRAWTGLRERVASVFRANLEPGPVGKAVGIGVFIGCLPLIGLHILICVLLARWMRLNQAVTVLAAHISNPLTLPFLLLAEIAVGEWILHGEVGALDMLRADDGVELLGVLSSGWDIVSALFVGSLVIGLVLGLALGVGSLVLWRLRHRTAEVTTEPTGGP